MNDTQEMEVASADSAKIQLMVHLGKSKSISLCSLGDFINNFQQYKVSYAMHAVFSHNVLKIHVLIN